MMQVIRVHDLQFGVPNGVCRFRAETLMTKEPGTIAWIDAMPMGSVLYDIGANVGIYSIYAASKGHRVVAIEPVPANYATLCRNIAMNHFEGLVMPVAMALGRDAGKVLVASRNDFAGSAEALVETAGLQILSARLDDLIEAYRLPQPTHIKIDTDGNEPEVLSGALDVLRQAHSVILETDERKPESSNAGNELLRFAGLTFTARHVCPLTPNSPIGMDHWHSERIAYDE